MGVRFTSLLDELTDMMPSRDKDLFIESRAQQVIASAAFLVRLIEENYDPEVAGELKRRLVNSIKSGDEMKFRRKIAQLRSVKEPGKEIDG